MGRLPLSQTDTGGGWAAGQAVPAVPICGPDSCSHFGEGEGRGLMRAEKPQPVYQPVAACVRCSLGVGTPAAWPHRLALGAE